MEKLCPSIKHVIAYDCLPQKYNQVAAILQHVFVFYMRSINSTVVNDQLKFLQIKIVCDLYRALIHACQQKTGVIDDFIVMVAHKYPGRRIDYAGRIVDVHHRRCCLTAEEMIIFKIVYLFNHFAPFLTGS